MHEVERLRLLMSTWVISTLFALGCAKSESGDGAQPADAGADAPSCLEGEQRCEGTAAAVCAAGEWTTTPCPFGCDDGQCSACGVSGCDCQPSCSEGKAVGCSPAGVPVEFSCDALQGMTCTPSGCTGACLPDQLETAYIGCDYYPTVLANPVKEHFAFAVIAANTADQAATVTVTRGGTVLAERVVEPGATAAIPLPWVEELKGPMSYKDASGTAYDPVKESTLLADGAYRLRSTRPITVYQASPLEYFDPQAEPSCAGSSPGNDCYSFTNDSSLLLPATALAKAYIVTAPGSQYIPGVFVNGDIASVVAVEDGTVVRVTPSVNIFGGPGVAPMTAKQSYQVPMNAGDVLQLVAAPTQLEDSVSGSVIVGDKPIQVLAGASAFTHPADKCCGDHLEEVVLPVEAWGDHYVAIAPTDGQGALRYTLRLFASFDDTVITADPPGSFDPVALDAGQVATVQTDHAVVLSGNQPFAAMQMFHGQEDVGIGDPSVTMLVPTAQFRQDYVFIAPTSYDANFVGIVTLEDPATLGVELDGAAIPAAAFQASGPAGPWTASLPLAPLGRHRLRAQKPIGAQVYGYGLYTSHAYPAGLFVTPISPTPPIVR